MTSLKKYSVRIFVIILVTCVMSIANVFVLMYNTDNISRNYKNEVRECTEARTTFSYVYRQLYAHQAYVSQYISADSDTKRMDIREQEASVRLDIDHYIEQLDEFMQGDRREQLYHVLYSNYTGYKRSVENIFKMVDTGNPETALKYMNAMLVGIVRTMNQNLSDIDKMTAEDIVKGDRDMKKSITMARRCGVICFALIFGAAIVCVVYSMSLVRGMAQYRNDVERELENQNKTKRVHNEKLFKMQNEIIVGVANIIENRDCESGHQVRRMSRYVELIAKRAREEGYCDAILTDEYIDLISRAAPLHDIGKLTVPEKILLKPGRLTPEEYEVVKTHAEEGERIMRDLLSGTEDKKYVDIAAEIAGSHHERWDGSGYPKGLSGGRIPLSARIMALADVFDALVSKRCYKEAMSPEEAIAVIRDSSGSDFDPMLVNCFLAIRSDIIDALYE